jgi:uncharacterized protein (DUF427 family)
MQTEEDYPILKSERIKAAREYAYQKLGDSSWADNILWAYNNPREVFEYIERVKDAQNTHK